MPGPEQTFSEAQFRRLRRFAIDEVKDSSMWEDRAIVALAADPDPNGWKPWRETRAKSGQWFLWRDPGSPDDIHADQVEPDEAGLIEIKFGCGLEFYPECQVAHLPEDVLEAIGERAQRTRR